MFTPNESFVEWLSFPLLFIVETPLAMFMFLFLLDIKSTKFQQFIYIILTSIFGALSNFFIPKPFNIILNYITMFIFILIVFRLSFLKSFIAMSIPSIVFSLIGNLLLKPFLIVLNISSDEGMTIPIYRLTYLLHFYIIILCINLFLKYKHISLNILDTFNKKHKFILFTNLTLGLLTIILQLIVTFYHINSTPLIFTLSGFVCLLLYFVFSLYSLIKATKLIITTEELKSAEAYNKSLSILHDNIRCFKHDFNNIVTTIGGFIKTGDIKGLEKYYSQLEDDCQRVNNIATLNPRIINNPGVFNLLNTKYHVANDKNIKINLEFFLDLNKVQIKIYEFCRILGILLDNAIEAASNAEEKLINIKFREERCKSRHVIIIENTYSNPNLNLENIFLKGFTEKPNHQGLGLWEVKKIINHNNNLNLYTTKDNKFFKQQLEIYYFTEES